MRAELDIERIDALGVTTQRIIEVLVHDGTRDISSPGGDSVDHGVDNESLVVIRIDGEIAVTLYRVNESVARKPNELCINVWENSMYRVDGDTKGSNRI